MCIEILPVDSLITETKQCHTCFRTLDLYLFRKKYKRAKKFHNSCIECEKGIAGASTTKSRTPEYHAQHRLKWYKRNTSENPVIVDRKVCPTCGVDKPSDQFYKTPYRYDGLQVQCKACCSAWAKNRKKKLKDKVFEKLGRCCSKCGFSDVRALQIDHVNGGGTDEYEALNYNQEKLIKRVLADTTGSYQILCANCNWIKRMENSELR